MALMRRPVQLFCLKHLRAELAHGVSPIRWYIPCSFAGKTRGLGWTAIYQIEDLSKLNSAVFANTVCYTIRLILRTICLGLTMRWVCKNHGTRDMTGK
mgnify:CR=1 FL=1